MRIISRKTLVEYYRTHPEAKKALDTWFHTAKASSWKRPTDVLTMDPKASIVANNRVVFDILGGRFRLVTAVKYRAGVVYIRFVGTHTEYNRIDATTV